MWFCVCEAISVMNIISFIIHFATLKSLGSFFALTTQYTTKCHNYMFIKNYYLT